MTVVKRDGVTWAAAKDGLAHATGNGDSTRALCGAIPIADRNAWPIREFCAVCLALEDGLRAERRRAKRKRAAA